MAREEIKIKLSSQGASKVKGELRGVEKTMNGLSSSVKGFIGAFVGVAIFTKVVSGLKNMISNTITFRDEIAKFSRATGASVEFLSAMSFAAERSGSSLQAVQIGMRGLIRSMQDAKDGLAEGVRKFDQLGISALDAEGNMRSAEEVFFDIADSLSAMTNETEKAALAQDIFGKSGLALVPLLEEGSAGIEKLTKRAAELGIVFDQEAAVAAEKAADAMTDFNTAVKATGQSLSTNAIPAATKGFGFLTDIIQTLNLSLGEKGFIRTITSALSPMKAITDLAIAQAIATGGAAISQERLNKALKDTPDPSKGLTQAEIDAAKELAAHQIIIEGIQQRILKQTADRLIHEEALLDLKQRGLVAFSDEELLQQRIAAGAQRNFTIEKRTFDMISSQVTQEKLLDQAKKAAQLTTKQTLVFNDLNLVTARAQVETGKFFIHGLTQGLRLFQGMDRFSKSLLRNVESMASQLAGKAFTAFLLNLLPGGGGFFSTFRGLLGIGGRAEGGPVDANQPVIVGENRRELFIPDTAGTIVPEVGGNLTININGAFVGNIDEFAEEIAQRSNQNFNRIAVNA